MDILAKREIDIIAEADSLDQTQIAFGCMLSCPLNDKCATYLKVLEQRKAKMQLLQAIVKEKGKEWAIAAMVDGSIGYHSPLSAAQRINELLAGKYISGCERTYACFRGDSLAEMEADFRYFMRKEQTNPLQTQRLLAVLKEVAKLKDIEQTTFGLAFPTMVF